MLFSLVAALALANAPPPGLQRLHQPDGSTFEARFVPIGRGVELEDADGYTLVGRAGEWTYARRDRGRLVSTGLRAGRGDPRAIGLTRHLRAAPGDDPEADGAEVTPAGAPGWPGKGLAPVVGMIRFPGGHPAGAVPKATRAQLGDLLFARGLDPTRQGLPSVYRTSVRDWYAEVSRGAFSFSGSASDVYGWAQVPRSYAWYADGAQGFGGAGQDARTLARDAVAALDPTVDFSRYDADGDGVVDLLVLVIEGWMDGSRDQLWPHFWSVSGVEADGVRIDRYVMVSEQFALNGWPGIARGDLSPIGLPAHEIGHALGLPDLYDTSYASTGIGYWGIMGHGPWAAPQRPAWPSAWSRVRLGWEQPIEVHGDQGVSLTAASAGGRALKVWIDPHRAFEYFLVEHRARQGSDAALPGEGLLVWHVDERITDRYPARNDVSANEVKGVALEQADGRAELDNDGQADDGDPFPGSAGNRSFTPEGYPHSRANDGTSSEVRITDIRRADGRVTARIRAPEPLGVQLGYDRVTAGRGACVLAGGVCASRSTGAVRFALPGSGSPHAVDLWTRGRTGALYTLRLLASAGGLPGAVLWSGTARVDADGWTRAMVDADLDFAAGDEIFASVEGTGNALFLDESAPSERSLVRGGGAWTQAAGALNLRLVLASGPAPGQLPNDGEPHADPVEPVAPDEPPLTERSAGGCSSAPVHGTPAGLAVLAAVALRRRGRKK